MLMSAGAPVAARRRNLSVGTSSVPGMNEHRLVATVLAALELAPGDPSDLSALLADGHARRALAELRVDDSGSDLLQFLVSEIDYGRVEKWQKEIEALLRDGTAVPVLSGDPEYPTLLGECWDRPPLLFVRGRLPEGRRALAIVGSRVADDATLRCTHALAEAAVAQGASVISGLAAGVDTQAHWGALSAGGSTVAVLGTGIERVFPDSNRSLAEAITSSGAVVSQFAPRAPRTSTTFLLRNCVIAGMAHTSLVMDGRARSGSRHQAEQAVRYERQVLLWRPTLADEPWAIALEKSNTNVTFVSDVEDALHAVLGRP